MTPGRGRAFTPFASRALWYFGRAGVEIRSAHPEVPVVSPQPAARGLGAGFSAAGASAQSRPRPCPPQFQLLGAEQGSKPLRRA